MAEQNPYTLINVIEYHGWNAHLALAYSHLQSDTGEGPWELQQAIFYLQREIERRNKKRAEEMDDSVTPFEDIRIPKTGEVWRNNENGAAVLITDNRGDGFVGHYPHDKPYEHFFCCGEDVRTFVSCHSPTGEQVEEPRLPKVGEVWRSKNTGNFVTIVDITPPDPGGRVAYRGLGSSSVELATSFQFFQEALHFAADSAEAWEAQQNEK